MGVGEVLFRGRVVGFWFWDALGSNIINLLVVMTCLFLSAQGTEAAVALHRGNALRCRDDGRRVKWSRCPAAIFLRGGDFRWTDLVQRIRKSEG
jgi:hypothetical protein